MTGLIAFALHIHMSHDGRLSGLSISKQLQFYLRQLGLGMQGLYTQDPMHDSILHTCTEGSHTNDQ